MIWKVLKKIITAPLHIVEHSYKRTKQGFAYLMGRPGYVQYGPEADIDTFEKNNPGLWSRV
jgi:hypothetical protein